MFHVHWKRMCILFLWDEKLSIYQWSPFDLGHCSISLTYIVQRYRTISLLIFCSEDLSIFDSGVLKSPIIFVVQCISFLKSSKIFLTYLGNPVLGAYMLTMFMFSWWIFPLSIMKCPSVSLFMTFVLKSYFVWCKYCYPSFFFLSICLEYLFPTIHFLSVKVFCPEVGVL